MGIKTTPRRISMSLADALDEVKKQRVIKGLDKKTISDARLTEGMVKSNDFKLIMDDLIRRPPKKK